MGDAMSDAPPPAPATPPQPEPALIERARRVGWALLVVAILAALAGRLGPEAWRFAAWAVAVAAGLAGLLAIVNVALVRGLYRELAVRRGAEDQPHADP